MQCRTCDVVYVNPPAREVRDYFDVPSAGGDATIEDREHVRKELDDVLRYAAEVHEAHRGRAPAHILIAGRMADELSIRPSAQVDAFRLTREQTLRLVHEADVSPIVARIGQDVDMIVLNQLLEACPRASDVAAELAARLPSGALLVIVYSNAASLPGRILRHNWRRFFHWKAVYFNSENLRSMLERAGLHLVAQSGLNTSYTVTRALDLALPGTTAAGIAHRSASARRACGCRPGRMSRSSSAPKSPSRPNACGHRARVQRGRLLTRCARQLLGKQFVLPHEVIVVESNSTDGTREIAQTSRDALVRIIYEDRPRGKGAAVRRGLEAATGHIVLIQDADFEYDLDDYDALLEPIVQRRTSFVLGSRSLGLDDWKVRRFARSRVKAFLMNIAQLLFARTFNILYQQRVTDVNTMFKVFRARVHPRCRFRRHGVQLRHRTRMHAGQERVQPDGSPSQLRCTRVRRGQEDQLRE